MITWNWQCLHSQLTENHSYFWQKYNKHNLPILKRVNFLEINGRKVLPLKSAIVIIQCTDKLNFDNILSDILLGFLGHYSHSYQNSILSGEWRRLANQWGFFFSKITFILMQVISFSCKNIFWKLLRRTQM